MFAVQRNNINTINLMIMETTNNKSKGVMDTLIENQGQMVDHLVDATKKLTKDVPFVSETLDKGNKMYKEAIHAQAELLDKTQQSINETAKNMNQSTEAIRNFFSQWFENQMNWAKHNFQTPMSGTPNFSNNPSDWSNNWQNWMNQMNSYWNQSSNMAPFFQMMNSNPFMNMNGMQSKMNDFNNQWSHYVKQYFDMMQNASGEWWKQFPNLTAAESYQGMNKMVESLGKFYELWSPMFKNIQDNTFNMDSYREMMSPEKYKIFIDRFFSFLPDDSRKQFDEYNKNFVQMMKQFSEMGLSNYQNMKHQFQSNPFMNSNPFNQMLEMYSSWKTAMTNAVSPLSRLFESNANVKNAQVWNEIYDRMLELNVKNNQLQYLVYQNGLKVMDKLAEKTSEKIQKGEHIDSIVKLYQEWMMLGDEVFTSLFESDAYSKLMTEVNALQMKIKQDLDVQMEKMFFTNLPIATRTEMDEVYKSMYDLKKTIREMERMMKHEAPVADKTSKKK